VKYFLVPASRALAPVFMFGGSRRDSWSICS
jgi:hypothetical protein